MTSQYDSWIYWVALILPNLIIGTISIVSMIFNYHTSKMNHIKDMVFTQREKVIDNFIEKSSELIALTDPLILNSKINEYTPTTIPHSQFMEIMQDLLSIDNRVQTLSSVIKLHTYSIYEENNQDEIADMFRKIDCVQEKVQSLVLKLTKLHSSNTQEGAFLRANINELKDNLERNFSEEFRNPYIEMVTSITNVAKLLRSEALHPPIKKISTPQKRIKKNSKSTSHSPTSNNKES